MICTANYREFDKILQDMLKKKKRIHCHAIEGATIDEESKKCGRP